MLPTGPYNLPALWEYHVVETIYPDPNALPEVPFLDWTEEHQVNWSTGGFNDKGQIRVLVESKKPTDVVVTINGEYELVWEGD